MICLYYNIISHKHQGSASSVAQYRLYDNAYVCRYYLKMGRPCGWRYINS
nr:MAG TPA: hypothetical protein [Caudoviricetes sp.]